MTLSTFDPKLDLLLERVVDVPVALVWTDTLLAGYRPAPKSDPSNGPGFSLTAVIELTPEGKGTRYKAWAMHADETGAKQHAAMGFKDGWGTALDQLVDYCKKL